MDPERLREVVRSAQRGQSWAYQELLEAYGPRLYGYFIRAVGSHHDAEDLLSEMALRLVRRLKTYNERGKFEPWLFRIAANLVRDRIRRLRANPAAMSLSAEDEFGPTPGDVLPGREPGVDAAARAAEASRELSAALGRLDEMTRQMVVLRHFGEMSFKEIAAVCSCPLGTVLARVHRGLRAMRRWMGGNNGTD
ncbi:MAG TPA: sigma-70 family RNA polymerase sigma factor [Phycisphaerae bacterium]|nr:sigma-70 family RNA polymerase sigma factor [Phycisphaerae bacterium]